MGIYTIQPGIADGNDTVIASALPDDASGYLNTVNTVIVTHGKATQLDRSLISFDISSVPSAAKIKSAHLNIILTGTTVGDFTILVRRLTRNFVNGQATWNSYQTGSAWTNPGGDLSTKNELSFYVPVVGGGNPSTPITVLGLGPMINDARSAGFNKLNLVLMDSDEANGNKDTDFFSADHATASNRPKLTIITVKPLPTIN